MISRKIKVHNVQQTLSMDAWYILFPSSLISFLLCFNKFLLTNQYVGTRGAAEYCHFSQSAENVGLWSATHSPRAVAACTAVHRITSFPQFCPREEQTLPPLPVSSGICRWVPGLWVAWPLASLDLLCLKNRCDPWQECSPPAVPAVLSLLS
jgi:hypothetical protein